MIPETFGVIGTTTLQQEDGTMVPVTIIKEDGQNELNGTASGRTYSLYDTKSNLKLGWMSIHVNFWLDKPNEAWVEIDRLYNLTNDLKKKKVKGVGKTLVEYAKQQSIELGLKGRLATTSIGHSQFFYWCLGFRPEVKSRVRLGLENVCQRLKRGETLEGFKKNIYEIYKQDALEETGKSEDQLTPEDVCFYDVSKRMQLIYDMAMAEKKPAVWDASPSGDSLRMQLISSAS